LCTKPGFSHPVLSKERYDAFTISIQLQQLFLNSTIEYE